MSIERIRLEPLPDGASGRHKDVEIQTPRTFKGPWSEAQDLARAEGEPVFVPVTPYADDRGWSLMNLLAGAMSDEGQINFSMQYPGIVKAWHRHDHQTDFWMCLVGHLKAGVYREEDNTAWQKVIGEQQPGVLVIPPPLWHGATCVGPKSAGLLYYVTRSYNPDQPDEHRRQWDSVEGFSWEPQHG